MALQGLSYVCIFKTFILALFPGKRYLLFPSLLSLLCLSGCASPWKRAVFKAKWDGFELAEFGSVKTTTCKDIGSGCNVPQELKRETFWEFGPHS